MTFTVLGACCSSVVANAKAAPADSTGSASEPDATKLPSAYRAMYLTLGLGGTGVGYASRFQLTGAYERWFAAGLLGHTQALDILGPTPSPSLLEAGAITGYHQNFGRFILSAGVGIAWISSVTRGALLESRADGHWSDRYAEITNKGLGVPFVLQALYHRGAFGAGAQLFGNYNANLPVLGIAGTLHLGDF